MKTITLDIEADGLLDTITQIYCICCRELSTGIEVQFTPDNLHDFVGYVESVQRIIGHNIVSYDIPAIHRFLGVDLNELEVLDTLLLSKLLNPDRFAHSLDWWGRQLGDNKIEFNDWSRFTPEMLEYCIQDVRLNEKVYHALVKEASGWDWSKAYALELAVAKIIQKQEEHGVKFDTEMAKVYHEELDRRLKDIEDKVEPLLPVRKIPEGQVHMPPKRRAKKDGSPTEFAKRYYGDLLRETEDGWYVDYPDWDSVPLAEADVPLKTHEPMRLANQADIKEWLMSEGWQPTLWNERVDKETGRKRRTSPKFTDQNKNLCPNLEKLGEKVEFIKDVVYWLSYRNRRNVILSDNGTGWLANPRLQRDGRLSATADTIGTNTGRFAHRVVANVPRVSSIFGKEMRSLFTVDPDHYMVGWDASGLEARIEAHYTWIYDEGEYARELLEGDIHSKNAEIFGCDRSTAKGGKYALTYGAQPPKLATTLDIPRDQAEKIFNDFWNGNSALRDLKNALIAHWKGNDREFIRGLDGRKVMTRSEHSVLNTLFQSGGIICMKQAMVLWDDWVKAERLKAAQVIHYHDEAQAEVHKSEVQFKQFETEEEANSFNPEGEIWSSLIKNDKGFFRAYSKAGELGVKSIRQAGKELGLNVLLDAEYCVGRSWADTH